MGARLGAGDRAMGRPRTLRRTRIENDDHLQLSGGALARLGRAHHPPRATAYRPRCRAATSPCPWRDSRGRRAVCWHGLAHPSGREESPPIRSPDGMHSLGDIRLGTWEHAAGNGRSRDDEGASDAAHASNRGYAHRMAYGRCRESRRGAWQGLSGGLARQAASLSPGQDNRRPRAARSAPA